MTRLEVTVDPLDVVWMLEHSVAVAAGVMLPTRFTARARVERMEVTVEIVGEVVGPVAESVAVRDRSGRGIKSEGIRRIPVARIVHEAARQVVWITDDDGGMVIGFGNDLLFPPSILEQWPDGDLDVFLRHVAALYRVAEALGEGPTASLASAAGVSRATAGRFVDGARRRGLLPPILGRAGELEKTPEGFSVVAMPENYAEWLAAKDRMNRERVVVPAHPSRDEIQHAEDQSVQEEIDRRRGK